MYKPSLILLIIAVISLVDARLYFPLINATIPTGYIPPDFRTIEARQATGRFVPFTDANGNYTGAVVLIQQPTEVECDINVRIVYLAGAVGAVCATSQRVLRADSATTQKKQRLNFFFF